MVRNAVWREFSINWSNTLCGRRFVPGLTAERYPEVVMKIAEAGHEIGHHGYAHERFAGQTIEQQIEIIEKSQRIFKELIGHEVAGFRTPSGDWAEETPKLLYERGFRYSSSMRGDDRPYRTVIDGGGNGLYRDSHKVGSG